MSESPSRNIHENPSSFALPPPEEGPILHGMVDAYRVGSWRAVEARIESHPEEVRILDAQDGTTVLEKLLRRRIEDYPPPKVIRKTLRAYPQAPWRGTPLTMACRRRASMSLLMCLMDSRNSILADQEALCAMWESYVQLLRGGANQEDNEQQVLDCILTGDREAAGMWVKLVRLINYCAMERQHPFRGLYSAEVYGDHDMHYFRRLMEIFAEQLTRPDERGRLPLHVLAGRKWTYYSTRAQNHHVYLNELLVANPDAVSSRDGKGNLPLHLAIEAGWDDAFLKTLVCAHPTSLSEPNGGMLVPFEVAACSNRASLTSVYLLLRMQPVLFHTRPRTIPVTQATPPKHLVGVITPEHRLLLEEIGSRDDDNVDQSSHYLHCLVSMGQDSPIEESGCVALPTLHAVASLPLCPAGCLRLFAQSRWCSSMLLQADYRGRLPLHHIASMGMEEFPNYEAPLRAPIPPGLVDPCANEIPLAVTRLSIILEAAPSAIRAHDARWRLPLHLAVWHGMPLSGVKMLVRAWPDALTRREGCMGLTPALLAACAPAQHVPADEQDKEQLSLVYTLLLAAPTVICTGALQDDKPASL